MQLRSAHDVPPHVLFPRDHAASCRAAARDLAGLGLAVALAVVGLVTFLNGYASV